MSDTGMVPLVERPEAGGAQKLIDRREAIRRVTALLGGVALVGGNALLTGCRDDRAEGSGDAGAAMEPFTAEEIAFLDEIAETILPETSTPGAKAAQTGAFMALMVTDTYYPPEQRTFREGMRQLEAECEELHGVGFMAATPEQRLALLERLDREQKAAMDARSAGAPPEATATPAAPPDSAEGDAYLPDQRQEEAATDVGGAAAITADAPPHYFRMMKELALLGYFTSEIGYNQAMRYAEAPGRFDPCVPYTQGEKAWAPHA
jgi:hypothetical protein